MIKLDASRCETLVKASVYAKAAPGVLSEFEEDKLWELNRRALGGDTLAECTLEEWAVIEQAFDGLQSAIRKAKIVPQNYAGRYGISIQL